MASFFAFGGRKTNAAVKVVEVQKPSSLKVSSSKSSLRTCQYNQMGCKKKFNTPKKKVSFHLEPVRTCRNNNESFRMKKYLPQKAEVEEDLEMNLESLSARSLPCPHDEYPHARNS